MSTTASAPAKAAPDPRYLALRNFAISMSVFNILGYSLFGFEQPWLWPLLALATGYSAELFMETLTAAVERRRVAFAGGGFRGLWTFLLPAHITSLAVNMLLYANTRIWPVLFGVVVGIVGKSIFRAPIKGRMRHFMNPSNLGITAALLVFPWVNIAPPYHFTENVPGNFRIFIPMVIIASGTVMNAMLTKKIPLIMGWAGGFAIQALLRWWLFDVAILSALAVMTGVAFVLFTNYMITDPGTTPTAGRAQFMFGSAVAGVYGVLMVFNVVYTLFFAVCLVCLVRGLGWWVAAAAGNRRAAARARTVEDELPASLRPEVVPA
jgi:enediyne biosynthesis protein E5